MRLSLSPVKLLCTRKPFWLVSWYLRPRALGAYFIQRCGPLVEHARPLPDGQSNARQAFDLNFSNGARALSRLMPA